VAEPVFVGEGQEFVAGWVNGEGPSPSDSLTLYLIGDTGVTVSESSSLEYFEGLDPAPPASTVWEYSDHGDPYYDEDEERWAVNLTPTPPSFNFPTAGGSIAGWYLVDNEREVVLWAKKYDTPISIVAGLTHTVDITVFVEP